MAHSGTRAVLLGLLAAASALPGCGFQPRGAAQLPDQIHVVGVRAPSVAMRDDVAMFLEGGGVKVVDASQDADALLNIVDEKFERRVLSVDPNSGKAREYELAYTFDWSLADRTGKQLVTPQSVRLVRDFVFDEDAILGKSREEDVLRKEMRRDAVQQLIRRLQAGFGS